MGKCWTCHRRRLKCDEGRPSCKKCQTNGVECLGYERRLTWVGGVARRGRMKDQLNVENLEERSRSMQLIQNITGETLPSTAFSYESAYPSSFSKWLVDPMLQDLDISRRFFIDYYEKRVCPCLVLCDSASNPWRSLISMIGESPGVTNAILALATCHFSHGTRSSPLCSSIRQTWDAASGLQKSFVLDLNNVRPGILQCLLIFKNRALKHLSDALADPRKKDNNTAIAIAALLLLEEVFETGSGSWNVHLEGVKKLLESKIITGQLNGFLGLERLIDDLRLFETFGSTFVRPGLFSQSLRSRFTMVLNETAEHTAVGCPHEIQVALDFVTTQRFSDNIQDIAEPPNDLGGPDIPALYSTLEELNQFDSMRWAQKMMPAQTASTAVSLDGLFHLCQVWKLAAVIYTVRVINKLISQPDSPVPALVNSLMDELTHCESNETLFKSLMWPVFILGTECECAERREWVLSAMYKLWRLLLCASTIQATLLLTSLWSKQEVLREQGGIGGRNVWSLINELSRSEEHCLIL